MNTHTSQFRRYVATGLLSAFLPSSACLASRDEDVAAESGEESGHEKENTLDVLWSGGPEEKRKVVEEAWERFDYLQAAQSEDEETQSAVEWLRSILRMEKDDWISSRLLQNLAPIDTAVLSPLYLDALKNSSPNVRWRALQWFGTQEDPAALPLLEDLWKSESRPWAREDLIEALAKNGSREHRDDFVRIAAGHDPGLASAAIRALTCLRDEGVIPHLARLAQRGMEPIRSQAVGALSSWPDSREALEAVLEASHSDDLQVRGASITALKEFESDLAIGRLLEMVERENDKHTRYGALQALEDLHPPGFASLLVDVLYESPSEETSSLQSAAIWALQALDDPGVLPRLRDLDPNLGGSGFDNLAGLIANLSRNRETSPSGSVWSRIGCSLTRRNEGVGGSGRFVIAPPEGFQSIRCWEAPDVPGDPEDFERLRAGAEVWVDDHFERGEESWVEVNGDEVRDCWVLGSQLQRISGMGKGDFTGAVDAFRREFDIAFEDSQSEAANALKDSGLLVVIEPGGEVVGVALSLHPEDIKSIPIVVDSYRDDGSILDEQVVALLNSLWRILPEQPILESFFTAHPEQEDEGEEPASAEEDDSPD